MACDFRVALVGSKASIIRLVADDVMLLPLQGRLRMQTVLVRANFGKLDDGDHIETNYEERNPFAFAAGSACKAVQTTPLLS